MRAAHFNADPNRSAKQQAMELVPKLAESFPLARAPMRLRLVVQAGEFDVLAERAGALGEASGKASAVERVERSGNEGGAVIIKCDPAVFAEADALCRSLGGKEGGGARVEVVDLAVHAEGGAKGLGLGGGGGDLAAALVGQLGLGAAGAGAGGSTAPEAARAAAPRPGLTCNSCRVPFETREAHREHFRTDWHRANLKRKAAKQPPLTKEEHEAEALLAMDDLDDFEKDFM